MNVSITFLLTAAITLLVLFTFGADLSNVFGEVSDSWTESEERRKLAGDASIAGPTGQWAGVDPTLRLTLTNTGRVALDRFADWDVVFEIQKDPGLGVPYLKYTSTSPGTNQWTVDGIYHDASSLQ